MVEAEKTGKEGIGNSSRAGFQLLSVLSNTPGDSNYFTYLILFIYSPNIHSPSNKQKHLFPAGLYTGYYTNQTVPACVGRQMYRSCDSHPGSEGRICRRIKRRLGLKGEKE